MKRAAVLGLVFLAACAATRPTTSYVPNYLLPSAAPEAQAQVEQVEGPWVFLRSGDLLVQVQAERIAQAVGIRLIFANLSTAPVRLEASDITLAGADGAPLAALKPEAVYQPFIDRSNDLEARSKKPQPAPRTADGVVNFGDSYAGASITPADVRIARAEAGRLAKVVQKDPFAGALVQPNHKLAGALYFAAPRAWPVTLQVRAGEQQLSARFSAPESPR